MGPPSQEKRRVPAVTELVQNCPTVPWDLPDLGRQGENILPFSPYMGKRCFFVIYNTEFLKDKTLLSQDLK